ncbi:sensor histidine kinase [Kitasatospora sp. NPDC059795]|uniref:sensor histidine kinase n=1 Tax=Kitasatospora sp. NPDC059795 TaxID=3346949 RepID=UPI0036574CE1
MAAVFRKALGVRRLMLLDAAAVPVFALLPVLSPLGWHGAAGTPGWAVWLPVLAASLPLAVRRVRPWPVFAVVLAAALASLPVGLAPTAFAAAAFAVYPVALSGPAPRGRVAAVVGATSAAGALVLTAGGGRHYQGGTQSVQALFGLLVVGATWAAGIAVRERRERVRRAIEQAGERARGEERLRIARDIHDVVTHSVGLIAVKAAVANHVAATRPDEARPALAAIEEISRKALTDLRATLVVLRADGDPAEGGDLRPARGLADLHELLRPAELAGVRTELTVHCPAEPPGGVALAAYRIVQEALTNTAKHAAPTRCRIRVAARDGELTVEVADDGPPGAGRSASVPGGGLGLVGMRERAHAHGGTLVAGPHEGGYRVRAVLPY